MYVAGNGRVHHQRPSTDRTLRHATAEVMPDDECEGSTYKFEDTKSIICAYAVDDRDVSSGDSGGPVIRAKDETLAGVISSVIMSRADPDISYFQIFTRLSYFYDWIALKTGLDLPKCDNQASTYQ